MIAAVASFNCRLSEAGEVLLLVAPYVLLTRQNCGVGPLCAQLIDSLKALLEDQEAPAPVPSEVQAELQTYICTERPIVCSPSALCARSL